jgi:argininosuccinate lyase
MPQKKNPDVFELVRGRSAGIFGALQALLVVQKGLPLAYNRDLQDDKPPVFESYRKTRGALELLALTIESVTFNPAAMKTSVEDDNLYATDLLEYLVGKGMTFTEAHETVGRAVRYGQESSKRLSDMSLQEWKSFSVKFDKEIFGLFDAKASVLGKKTIGSTHPAMVKREIAKWKQSLR